MSVIVELSDLDETLDAYPWCYLITVSTEGRSHALAVPTAFADGVFTLTAGRTARANAQGRADVTLLFPGPTGSDYSLVVDGTARVEPDHVEIAPVSAVLHRPAL